MKIQSVLLALLFLLLAVSARASTPITRAWGKLVDLRVNSSDLASAMCIDSNGNTFVVNQSGGSGPTWWYIQKYDPYGSLEWSTPVSFVDSASAKAICTDKNGSVIAVGSYYQYPAGNLVTLKLDSHGTPLWLRSFNGPGDGVDFALGVTSDLDNNVIVGGFVSDITTPTTFRIVYSSSGSFVTKNVDADIVPESISFTVDRFMVSTGYESSGGNAQSAAFAVLDDAGALSFGEAKDNDSVNRYKYITTTDTSGNIYVGMNRYHVPDDTQKFSIRVFDKVGNVKYSSLEAAGKLVALAANDPSHYYAAITSTDKFVKGYSKGTLLWTKAQAADRLTAYGVSGVVATFLTGQTNPFGVGMTKLAGRGAVQWSISYNTPGGGDAFLNDVQVVNDQLYAHGYGYTATADILLLKYTEGVAISAMGLAANSINGGQTVDGSVSINLPAPAGGFDVQLISSLPGVLGVNPSLVIPEGATYAKFTAKSSFVDATYSGVIYARAAGVQRAASTLILPANLASVTVSNSTVAGGTAVTGTVTLSSKTGLSGRNVALSSSDTTAATVPANVYVPPGATLATFTITTKPVTGSSKSVTINAKLAGTTKSAALTVTP